MPPPEPDAEALGVKVTCGPLRAFDAPGVPLDVSPGTADPLGASLGGAPAADLPEGLWDRFLDGSVEEIEMVLLQCPGVHDCAVFGIPDAEMGQSVKAVVQTVDPADGTPEFGAELLAWLRDRLTHYKCPRSISFEAQLPRTDTGKLYKQSLIDKYSN